MRLRSPKTELWQEPDSDTCFSCMPDLKKQLADCAQVLEKSQKFLTKMQTEVLEYRPLLAKTDFWATTAQAQQTLQTISQKEKILKTWQGLQGEFRTLTELLQETTPESLTLEITNFVQRVQEAKRDFYLTGPFDQAPALLAFQSGAGGVDACDCTELILRMFLRWAERQVWPVKILERSLASPAGLKSATIEINGPQAFGLLKAEQGAHRIVRRSPFNAAHSRETSFVRVAVWPKIVNQTEFELKPTEFKTETFCASGAGGQHVNRTESAVRLTHLATGLQATCQSERSQQQNKTRALLILRGKVARQKMQEREDQERRLKGKPPRADFGGDTIRSYVLDDKRVKDLRTGLVSHDPTKILDGELNEFLEASLLQIEQV